MLTLSALGKLSQNTVIGKLKFCYSAIANHWVPDASNIYTILLVE